MKWCGKAEGLKDLLSPPGVNLVIAGYRFRQDHADAKKAESGDEMKVKDEMASSVAAVIDS